MNSGDKKHGGGVNRKNRSDDVRVSHDDDCVNGVNEGINFNLYLHT